MINLKDFSDCKLSSRNLEYGGRGGEKRGIVLNDSFWFLKFPKNASQMNNTKGLSYVTSPLNEFIGSNIYKILGYDVHETILGVCFDGKRYKVVCACKDFIADEKNELLIPYTSLRNDSSPEVIDKHNSSSFSASDLEEIVFQLDHNTILSKIPGAKERFWDVVIIDMLINNNDRNEDNWGVIKNRIDNIYRLAPIYDCGGCFYGKNSEERIISILNDSVRLESSALNGITAYEIDGADVRNTDLMIYDNNNLKQSIKRVRELVTEKKDEIISFMNDIPSSYNGVEVMSDARKEFYIKTFLIRLDELLKVKL